MTKQEEFREAIENNDLSRVKTLLKNPRVYSSDKDNTAINICFLLWSFISR